MTGIEGQRDHHSHEDWLDDHLWPPAADRPGHQAFNEMIKPALLQQAVLQRFCHIADQGEVQVRPVLD